MHPGILAIASPLVMAIVCLWSGGVWLMLWRRNHAPYMLLTAISWLALCSYFSLLAISAGHAPIIERGDLAPFLREWLLVVALIFAGSKSLMLVMVRRSGQAAQAHGDAGEAVK